ncbi:helix-turn-helix domain-containing protein [Streptomyces sp. NPDC018045]|uniref:helix-turn-helix domain-containing protein n=1 Tax=Streptomyces sp. NPDC018045 TaxID=3365037 RepID=UPI003798DE7B
MPRWRALPEELDPQVKEFASQLRRLVERSGLSLAAVADRTGYSKTSWERYLNGRLLPPQRAVVALAEATGTHTGHLTTMWELAERAWSRSEMRHDVTMEAIRVAQARAALGEFGPPPGKAKPGTREKLREKARGKGKDRNNGEDKSGGREERGERPGGSAPGKEPAADRDAAQAGDQGHGAAAPAPRRGDELPSAADFPGLAASSPAPAPPPPAAPDTTPPRPAADSPGSDAGRPGKVVWPRLAGSPDAAPATPPPRHQAPPYDLPRQDPGGRPAGPDAVRPPGRPAPPAGPGDADRQLRRRRVTMFLAGVVGALLVIAAAVLLFDIGGAEDQRAAPTPSVSPSKKPVLPTGVKCAGADCAGKDPEAMGCGGRNATSPSRGFAGSSLIEVRYSKVCGAAWARITGAAPGDEASISSAGRTEKAAAGRDGDAYTAMVPVSGDPAKVTACGTTAVGTKGCAKPVPAGAGRNAG